MALRLPKNPPLVYLASHSGKFLHSPICNRRTLATFSKQFSRSQTNTRRLESCLRSASLGAQRREFHASSSQSSHAKDPYQVLGVAKDASAAEIKKVYFQLAKKYHPDTNKNSGAKDRFVEIQTAYDILSDDKKRAAYDRYGAASQQPGFDPDAFANARGPFGAGGFGGFQDFGAAFGGGGGRSQADLFETLFGAFGGGGRRPGGFENHRGDDIGATVGVSFMESCKGTTRTVNVTPVVDCKPCSGSGLKPGAKRTSCMTCGGTGTRTFVIESGFQMASTCPACQGTGSTVPRSSQCGECSGVGKVKVRKQVEVKIPAGVEDGMTIRVPGAGDQPISGKGPAGDLLVRVNVAASKSFRRQGVNLYHDTRIPLHTALLGGRVRVPTLDGDVEVRVPAGTQVGEECVLKGRGVSPVYGGEKGDLFVSFNVQIPRSLTKRQREILQQYADDVEGRSTTTNSSNSASSSSSSSSSSSPKSDRNSSASEETNGTVHSFGQPSSSEDGWLSRAWSKVRELIGSR